MTGEEFYGFGQMLEGVDEEMMVMSLGVVGIIALVIGLIVIVGHIFQSIGLYTIAKRRGIANPWLAWLPVGYYWIAGSIADQYQYVVNGAVKNKRTLLLVLSIAGVALSSFIASDVAGGFVLSFGQETAVYPASAGTMGAIINMLQSALEIATFIFWHWSLYELYSSCNPKNNVLFLVLGIIFGIAVPYFIFACRNNDLGMPPRREEPRYGYQPEQQSPYQPNPEPRTYQDPWEN